MRKLPDIPALSRASSQEIHKLWEGLGYYSRARNLRKAAREIVAHHGGKFPSTFEAVLALPGIGPYTAGAICSIAFDQSTPIVDGNIMRVFTRLFCLSGDPRKPPLNQRLWKLAASLVGAAFQSGVAPKSRPCSRLNQSLMELGALICTPRQPKCGVCPVRQRCEACQTGTVDQFPQLPKRPKPTKILGAAFVISNRGRYLVRQRSGGMVNGHLWEFPNRQIESDRGATAQIAMAECLVPIKDLDLLCTIRHSITRYRHTLHVFRANGARRKDSEGEWLTLEQMKRLPFSSAHKKILDHLICARLIHNP